jgi:hypothetical protein
VTNRFGDKNFMQPMRRLRGGLSFFLLGFGGAGGEGVHFLFFWVPKVFPSGSQKFPQNSQHVP